MTSQQRFSKRIPELDGIRGIAILLVLVLHFIKLPASGIEGPLSYAVRGLGLAWTGVDLFFVLSGFLIGGILIDQRGAANYFRLFYFRRVCRIFPLYLAWLGIFYVLMPLTERTLDPSVTDRVWGNPMPAGAYFGFIQNWFMASRDTFGAKWLASTWSLAIEEQFYLVLPFVVCLARPKHLPWILAGLIGLTPVARAVTYLWHPGGGMACYVLTFCRTDALLLGAFGAWALRQEAVFQWVAREQGALRWILGILLLGVLGLAVAAPGYRTAPMCLGGYTWMALFYLMLVAVVVAVPEGRLGRLASWSPFRRLGRIAYGVYLVHTAIIYLAHGLFLGQKPTLLNSVDVVVTLAALVASIGLAWVSWEYFESPIVAFGQRRGYEFGPRGRLAKESSEVDLTVPTESSRLT